MSELFQRWLEPNETVFARIRDGDGWPKGAKYLTMTHSVEDNRPCYFNNKIVRDEMNTTLFSVDDYLWWCISAEKKEAIRRTYFAEHKDLVQSFMRSIV